MDGLEGSEWPQPDFLYHWSPQSRRKRIERVGMMPGSRSTEGMWKPPYVCFALDPDYAWQLSGGRKGYDAYGPYDLWQLDTYDDSVNHWELIFDHYQDTGRVFVKEYRIYERVYKRALTYIASR